MANENFTVTEAIVLAPGGDTDLDTVIDPGETVRVTVQITNNSTNPGATVATGLEFSQILDGMTLVNQAGNDVNVSPIAFGDSYTAVGNTLLEVGNATAQTGPQSAVAGHVTDNDLEFFGDSFTISSFQSSSANGGTVTMVTSGAEMGAFTYVSAAGFTGTDTFTYTITDKGLDGLVGGGDDLVSTATVTINVISNQVWYVDSSFVGVSNGTSTNPYTSLAQVSGASGGDGDGDIIHLATGTGDYTGGITLLNNQTLHGAGTALTVGGFNLTTAGTDATITNAAGNGVTLASGNTLTGFTVGNTTGFDIANTAASTVGTLTVSNVVLNGSGGLFRADFGGTLNVALDSATSTAAGAVGIRLDNVDNSTFTVGGVTTIDDATTDGIAITNSQGSTFTFTGKVTVLNDAGGANGDGVDLQTNNSVDSTFNFNGGVDITVNGTNAFGFRAASSGVVNILNPGANNQITSNNGTALFVNPTQFNAALTTVTAGDGGTGDGIHLEGVSGTGVTIGSASITGVGGDGVEILNSSASVTIGGGAIGTPTGDGVNVTGGTGAVSIAASITKTTAGNVVEVNNHETGNVTFSGTLSATGGANNGIFVTESNSGTIAFTSAATKVVSTGGNTGVSLTNNSGATINFQNGALDIDTTGGTGFNATGGGTIGVASASSTITSTTGGAVNLNNVAASFTGGGLDIDSTSGTGFAAAGGGSVSVTGTGNSINATSGSALNINGTTIGASDVTFARIDSGAGGNNGISLVNTGTSGGVKVTGTGSAGSGGTITGKTGGDGSTTSGIGIYLDNTSEFSIDRMNLTTFDNNGIFGKSVNGIRVTNTTINGTIGTSSGSNDAAVAFGTDSGNGALNGFANGSSSLFDNVNISGGVEHNVEVYQSSGTYNFTIRNSFVHDNSAALGGDGILIETYGTAHGIMRVATTDFDNNKSQAVQANALADSHLELTLHDNDISNTTQGNEGFVLQNAGNGDLTVAVTNNVFGGSSGGSIQGTNIFVGNVVNNASSSAFLNATISGNTITQTAGVNRALSAFLSSNAGSTAQSVSKILIDNNTITTSTASEGIFVSTPDPNTAPRFFATVTNNTVNMTNAAAFRGIAVQATQGVAGQGATGFAQISGNNVERPNGVGVGINDIRIRQANPGGGATNPTMTIDPFTSASAVAGTVVDEDNPLSTGESAGTVTVANGTIQLPSNPATPSLPGFLEAGDPAQDDAPAEDSGTPPPPTDDTPAEPETPSDPTLPADEPAPDASVIVDDGYLSQAELDFFVDAAMQRWIATGLTAEQVAALEALTFNIAEMPGQSLGSFDNGVVSLDNDGAGRGWYADATPLEDSEFANVVDSTRLTAVSGTAAAGRYDLLTTVLHEMGHALGLSDLLDAGSRNNLLYGYLFAGERRLPGGDEADGATVGSVTHEAFAGSLIEVVPDDGSSVAQDNVFNLPPGQTVTIQWDATIDGQSNQLIDNPQNSGTVEATNGVGFPDTASNTVTTVLDSLTLAGVVWNDNGAGGGGVANGIQSGTEPGITGVAVTLFADTGTVAGVWDASDAQIATTTTGGSGVYTFAGLAAGEYIVGVDLSNFGALGALLGTQNSPATSPEPIDPDNNIDADDNGARAPGQAAYSSAITLAFNTEPTPGTGNDTNNTLDFAFFANVAPVVDLNTGAAGVNDSNSFTEGGAAAGIGAAIAVTDVGGDLIESATITITDAIAGDSLTTSGVLPGGIVAGGSGTATLTLTGAATPANYAAALALVRFSSSSDNPTAFGADTSRSITVVANDGEANSATATMTMTVVDTNDAPVLTVQDDTVSGTEDTNLVFNAASSNAITVSDVDDASLTVSLAALNGVLTLFQTTGLAFTTGDGTGDETMTFSGTTADINNALEGLIYRGDLNYEGSDTLSILVDDGDDTDSQDIAILLADDGKINGDAGNNVLNGTPGPDSFRLEQGGNDTVNGLAGNDGFYFGAAFTGADTVDGGDGDNDQIGLQGDYTGGNALVLTATTITNVEVLAVLPGFDYNITMVDANVPGTNQLTIFAGNLGPDDNLTFNGSAESTGSFKIYGGQGIDLITTGGGNDAIYFGPNKFNPLADQVNGGTGINDQLALDGDYTMTLTGTAIQNIDVIALLKGVVGDLADYDLTLGASLLGAGQDLTIWGVQLQTDLTVDGSAVVGDLRLYGGTASDRLTGGSGDDWLWGGADADFLTGGNGVDTFNYENVAQSRAIGFGFDRLIDFDDDVDKIDLPNSVSISGFAGPTAALANAATLSSDLEGANNLLGLGQAVVFTANDGDLIGRSFLLIDANGTAGYQATGDFLIELVTPTTAIDQVGMFI